jgi:hypothetical protein
MNGAKPDTVALRNVRRSELTVKANVSDRPQQQEVVMIA